MLWRGHWNDTGVKTVYCCEKLWELDTNALVFSSRSTLCSVMAQLTEDIQPSFETTLKSKAVSENCNVKFTCVVSGKPTLNSLVISMPLLVLCWSNLNFSDVKRQDVTNLKTLEGRKNFTLKAQHKLLCQFFLTTIDSQAKPDMLQPNW